MKLLTLTIVAAFGLSLPTLAFAQEKKKKTEAAPAAGAKKPAAAGAPAAPAKKAPAKAIPMYVRADSIDAAGKSFTMKTKEGKEIKHMLSETTEIKNGEAAAKLEDIKEGDWVSGSRMKKSDTEYDVVKITKFGPKPEAKDAKGAKKEAPKAEEKTPDKK